MFDCGADDVRLAGWSGDEQVEIPNRLPAAAQRTSGSDLVDAGELADEIADGVGMLLRFVDAEAAGVFAMILDAFEQLGNKFFTHARQFGELACLGSGFKAVYIAYLAGRPDKRNGLWTHAGQAEKLQHRGFVLLQQLFAKRKSTGRQKRLDVSGHAFADPRDSKKLFGVIGQCGELRGLLLDSLCSTAVGADAEGISGVDLEESRGFIEESGDRDIVHEVAIREPQIQSATEPVCNRPQRDSRQGDTQRTLNAGRYASWWERSCQEAA